MKIALIGVLVAVVAVGLVAGGKAFGFDPLGTLAQPTVGVPLEVAQIQPNCAAGSDCATLVYSVKFLCGQHRTLGAGIFRTEINVHNINDVTTFPIYQTAVTGAFSGSGGSVTTPVTRSILARRAVRIECPDIVGTTSAIGFVRIQTPSTSELAVTAVWTRTY